MSCLSHLAVHLHVLILSPCVAFLRRRASKLKSNDPEPFFLLARLHFETGARADALTAIRECVKLDADHKPCYEFVPK
jgi:hypothetical protein